MPLFIKICGITRVEDALAAASLDVNAIGLNFFPGSPRYLPLDRAAEIARALPTHVRKVGVFVNAPEEEIKRCAEHCALDFIQFHGDEPPEVCRAWGRRAIRAVRLHTEEDLALLPRLQGIAMIVCDAAVPGAYGGTGQRANWELARRAQACGIPILLAGGLTPENVAEALRTVHPYGVDVAGGVEAAPGIKDVTKMAAFVRAAREAADAP